MTLKIREKIIAISSQEFAVVALKFSAVSYVKCFIDSATQKLDCIRPY